MADAAYFVFVGARSFATPGVSSASTAKLRPGTANRRKRGRPRQTGNGARSWALVYRRARSLKGCPVQVGMLAASYDDARPRRRSVVEESLANDTLTYHAWPSMSDGD